MKKNNKKGFTLVELVIVVAVMAVLVAVAIPTVGAITSRAQNAVNDSNARTIESIIKLAEAEASKGGDGVTTVTEQQVWTALTDAKLGIDTGSFTYDVKAGTVVYGGGESTATSKDLFVITFAKADPFITVKGATTVTKAATPAT